MTNYTEKRAPLDHRIHVDFALLQSLQRFAKNISFLPKQPAGSVLNGQHASKLRGRGLSFEELRQYQKGDDVRTIDWKVTARTRVPHVRVYTEERDRPVLLLVDQRMSMFFGSRHNMKSVTAAEAAAIAAWRIRLQGDRIGGMVFGDDNIAELTPKSSTLALNRFMSVVAMANSRLSPEVKIQATVSLNQVINSAIRISKPGTMVFIFSDFHDIDEQTESLVRRLSINNDVLLFPIFDPLSEGLPDDFHIIASDGDLQVNISASAQPTKQGVAMLSKARSEKLLLLARKYGVSLLPLTTAEDTEQQIIRLLTGGV